MSDDLPFAFGRAAGRDYDVFVGWDRDAGWHWRAGWALSVGGFCEPRAVAASGGPCEGVDECLADAHDVMTNLWLTGRTSA